MPKFPEVQLASNSRGARPAETAGSAARSGAAGAERLRVLVVAESFFPQLNGVAHSALRTAEDLFKKGHIPVIVSPETGRRSHRADDLAQWGNMFPVIRVRSIPLPGYPEVRVALPGRHVARAISLHQPHIIHLASPFVLGSQGIAAARKSGIATVAVFQTDMAAYARTYLPSVANIMERQAWRRIRNIHSAADRTLAPSESSRRDLVTHGIPRVHLWPRGVDSMRFSPHHRDHALRRALAPAGEVIVGYVGRLAPEKQVELMAGVCSLPGVRVVIVGDGPCRTRLERALPGAIFLGRRTGHDLARVYASLDIFVHTGQFETFGQTIQEAMASRLPVVAPAAGGPLDLVDHGRTGFLIPAGDGSALCGAVDRLARSGGLRSAFGHAGRTAVAARTWDSIGDVLITHYRQALRATTEDLILPFPADSSGAPTGRADRPGAGTAQPAASAGPRTALPPSLSRASTPRSPVG